MKYIRILNVIKSAKCASVLLTLAVIVCAIVFTVDAKDKPALTDSKMLSVRPNLDKLIILADDIMRKEDGKSEDAAEIYRAVIFIDGKRAYARRALLGLASCKMIEGDTWGAFRAVEESFPNKFIEKEITARVRFEFKIAETFFAKKSEVIKGTNSLNGYQASAKVYSAIVYNDPHSKFASASLLRLGDCNMALGDIEKAKLAYRRTMKVYEHAEEAHEARVALAKIILESAYDKGVVPPEKMSDAETMLRRSALAKRQTPQLSARLKLARAAHGEAKANELMSKAKFYLKQPRKKQRKAALFLLKEIVQKYPDTESGKAAKAQLSVLEGE